jgi:hypothetical protein
MLYCTFYQSEILYNLKLGNGWIERDTNVGNTVSILTLNLAWSGLSEIPMLATLSLLTLNLA